jgi:hypothetical protein
MERHFGTRFAVQDLVEPMEHHYGTHFAVQGLVEPMEGAQARQGPELKSSIW